VAAADTPTGDFDFSQLTNSLLGAATAGAGIYNSVTAKPEPLASAVSTPQTPITQPPALPPPLPSQPSQTLSPMMIAAAVGGVLLLVVLLRK
jgi:hypothetical protein